MVWGYLHIYIYMYECNRYNMGGRSVWDFLAVKVNGR